MIPEISLEKIVSPIPFIPWLELPYQDGALPDDQARILLSILINANPREVLEIGTFWGHTTMRMAYALPKTKIHTIDLPSNFNLASAKDLTDFHLINRRIAPSDFQTVAFPNIVRHFNDTRSWDFREAGHPTFFFIDGSHSYEYCKNDSDKCYELNQHAVFIWHDLAPSHPGVLRLIREWRLLGRDVCRIAPYPLGFYDPDSRTKNKL